jgi:predicted alpha/beta superfamily hydrolase
MFKHPLTNLQKPFFALLTVLVTLFVLSGTSYQASADVETRTQDYSESSVLTTEENDLSVSDDFMPINPSRISTFLTSMPQLDGRERTIFVYLPSTYDSSERSYPVLYLHNARDIFVHASGSMHEWYLYLPVYEYFSDAFVEEAIVIGIPEDYDHHWDELSPWVNSQMHTWVAPWYAEQQEGGEGDAYLKFLVDQLKPEIDQRYRTLPGRENTAIGGYEMGGLFALYAGLTRADVFSRVQTISPAVWFAENGGTWLSDNHLINLIDGSNISENVTFKIEVSAEQRQTDLEAKPDIYDSKGMQITYAQAYLEGAQAVMEALSNRGLALSPQNEIPPLWVDQREGDLPSLITPAYTYHFPLFYMHEMTNFTISMQPYLDRNRRIWVYLPPDYYDSERSYPVMYVMDALRHFNPYDSSTIPDIDDWKTDEILDGLHETQSFPGIIVVGIEHHPTTYRWSEYNRWTQYNMDNWVKDGSEVVVGEGDAFVSFIINKLKPTIDSNYRTLSDRNNTAIGGGSRVGYLAIYAGLAYPETFSKVMAMSPAVWLAEGGTQTDHPIWLSNNRLVNWINTNAVPTNIQFFLYVGGNETSTGGGYPYVYRTSSIDSKITYPEAYREGAQAIRAALINNGLTPTWRYQTDGEHNPSYWRNYFVDALTVFGFYPGAN